MWTAAILAGGSGRRMGGVDKSALPIGTQTIIGRQLDVLRTVTPHILLVGGSGPVEGAVRVADRWPGTGALGGLATALEDAPSNPVVVLACDMPFITPAFLTALIEATSGVDAAIPRDEHGWHPLCACYQRTVARTVADRLDQGVRRVLDGLAGLRIRELGPDALAPFNPDETLLMNVNTPDDYAAARRYAAIGAAADVHSVAHASPLRKQHP
jgi:molybdopterin-guanine dinucleotide biosynthesis protein A